MTPKELQDLLDAECAPVDVSHEHHVRLSNVLGGDTLHPVIHAPVYATPRGKSLYLREAGVALLARPQVALGAARGFLDDVEPDGDYLCDEPIAGASALVKFAGQLCYMSVGRDRTRNADAAKYLQHVKASGHGSVLEHAQYTLLLYGVSRALTHELVRHRAGAAYSQLSQRYVPARRLRFVEAHEYASDKEAHESFEDWIDCCAVEYDRREVAAILREHPHDFDDADVCRKCHEAAYQCDGEGVPAVGRACGAEGKTTEARKRVRQAARRCLPNETEAPIVFSGNLRTLRHCVEMRCSKYADVEIRRAFWRVFLVLANADPMLWDDYCVVLLSDGTHAVETPYRKV